MVSMCGEDTARSAEGALPTALLSWAGRLWGGAGQLGHRPSGLLPIPQGSPQTPLCPDSSRLVSGAPATLIYPPVLASCLPLPSKGGTSSLAEREGVPPLGGLWVSPASSLSPFFPPCILHLSFPRIPLPTFPPQTTGDGKDLRLRTLECLCFTAIAIHGQEPAAAGAGTLGPARMVEGSPSGGKRLLPGYGPLPVPDLRPEGPQESHVLPLPGPHSICVCLCDGSRACLHH